jgi:hypothetical protein
MMNFIFMAAQGGSMKKEIDCIEITAKILIRKDYIKDDPRSGSMKAFIADLPDRIGQGIEIPLESIDVKVKQ